MNLNEIKQAYFLGIGGIGMSAIARYFHSLGMVVSGYDKTETTLTKSLISEGIDIHYQDLGSDISKVVSDKETCLIVLTPAIPQNHLEWKWLSENNYTILKRAQVLGLITDAYRTIGVAGTHGKTTTSSLLAHILKQSAVDCSAFLGGIATNYETNLLLHKQSELDAHHQMMVVEADEFDRSFLTLHPEIAIITSTDADHLDIYGEHEALKKSFAAYAHQARKYIVVKKELELNRELIQDIKPPIQILNYSVEQHADFYADNIRIENADYYFDLHSSHVNLKGLKMGIPGLHNIENAVAAAAAAILSGVQADEIRQSLENFRGVKRRFEYCIKTNQVVYIDDYAHHPEELNAILKSVKNMYPEKRMSVIFQPHLYSRTRDFSDGFSKSLSIADELLILDIYPARELPIPGVTSNMLLDKITTKDKQVGNKDFAIEWINKHKPELLVTVGAGDIDTLVKPLTELIKQIHGI